MYKESYISKELLSQNRNLLRQNNVKTLNDNEQFIYNIAHDLQAPIRAIVEFSNIIGDRYNDILDEEGQMMFKHVQENGRSAQNRLQALLQYSRLCTNPFIEELIDVKVLLLDVINNLQAEYQESVGDFISYGDMPVITGDKKRLFILFYETLDNAIRYQYNNDKPEIKVEYIEEADYHHFLIKDNGLGIKAKDFKKAFVMFMRFHREYENSGLGMGLCLAENITHDHNGNIWFSEIELGSSAFNTCLNFTIAKQGLDDNK